MFCFQIGPLTSVGRQPDQDHRRLPQGRRRQPFPDQTSASRTQSRSGEKNLYLLSFISFTYF